MPTTYSDTVSAEIRAEMGRQRLTQVDLAGKLGIKQAHLSRRLTGEVTWRVDEVMRVALILGVPFRQLMPDLAAS